MTTQALATQEAAQPPATNGTKRGSIRDMVESPKFKEAVAKVLPKHLTPERFVRIAILAMTRTTKLRQCTQESVINCLMTLSQFGLEPDGRRAHLIPYKDVCTLIIDYKGLAELVMRSGMVSFIHADVVCENDEFEYDRGEVKHHRVNLRADRGEMYAAYVIVRMKDGGEKSEVMSKTEIIAIKNRSRSGNNGPWVTDFNEMAKKTVFRRASKWLSLSSDFRDAIEAEDAHDPIVMGAGDFAQIPSDDQPARRMRLRGQQETPTQDEALIDPPASDDVSQIDPEASYAGDEQ